MQVKAFVSIHCTIFDLANICYSVLSTENKILLVCHNSKLGFMEELKSMKQRSKFRRLKFVYATTCHGKSRLQI